MILIGEPGRHRPGPGRHGPALFFANVMNIKTTILLLVLLVGVGGYVIFSRETDKDQTKPVVHTLVDVKSSDVTRFTIDGSDGKKIAAQKSTDASGQTVWKLTLPVAAMADTYKINSLLDSVTTVNSSAEVAAASSTQTGLDKPSYTVHLFNGSQDTKVLIGDHLTVSDGVYVRVGDHDSVDVVPTSLSDALDKPASDLRKTQLFETASPSVQQFTITHKDGSQLVLEKQATGWKMIKPTPMAADSSAVDDLISAVINMTPVEFIDDASQALGLNRPVDTVMFSTAAPSTQPATTMPGAVTVIFGGYDDLAKKNIFAQTPDGTIVKVAATVLDSLNKKPFELRDKTVLDIDPSQVTHLEIAMEQPATTQPVAAAISKGTLLGRRKKEANIGPVLPTTGPTSAPASKTDWYVAGPTPIDADDAKVTALLGQFHPLKADKYVEKPSTAKVVKKFTITLTPASGVPMVLTLIDPGNDAALIGSYNGVTFEMPRSIATDLNAEFVKPAASK